MPLFNPGSKGSILDSALSVTGSIPKASLILFTSEKNRTITNTQIANIAETALSDSSESMMRTMSVGAAESGLMSPTDMGAFRILEVQYNPNSIQLQANAEEQPMLFLQQNLEEGVPNQLLRPPSVTLHVDLFFDAVNLADSFMWEKFSMGLSGQTAVNVATSSAKLMGKTWSVQNQTNCLLGAMMHKNTRFIIFKWADMTFAGELTEAIAKYTMFSPSGRPVRSTITLRITQTVQAKDDINYWNNAFDAVIGHNLEGMERPALRNMQNLFTFNF